MDDLPLSACWTLPDHVDRAARQWPDTEALVFGSERLTFAGFAEHTRAIARGLVALGVSPGQKVGVFMENVPDMLTAIYGAARTGAVPMPINGRFKARELRYVIGHADVAVLIASGAYAELVAEALAGPDAPAPDHIVVHGGDPDGGFTWGDLLDGGRAVADVEVELRQRRIAVRDIAMLMYTSGTTANPKGCLISTSRSSEPDGSSASSGSRRATAIASGIRCRCSTSPRSSRSTAVSRQAPRTSEWCTSTRAKR